MTQASEENQKQFIDRYLEEGFQPDYWWMDAGWYIQDLGWTQTGTWKVDKRRFPNGLRAISDHAHSKGVKTILWFEPERVAPDTELFNEHPACRSHGRLPPRPHYFPTSESALLRGSSWPSSGAQ